MLTKCCLKCTLVDDFVIRSDNFDVVTVMENRNIYCVIYRPPDADFKVFLTFFSHCLIM